jgi:hypothetical protein
LREARRTAALTFSGGNRLVRLILLGKRSQAGNIPMTFASGLSVLAAYVALAFVGAIVLGIF